MAHQARLPATPRRKAGPISTRIDLDQIDASLAERLILAAAAALAVPAAARAQAATPGDEQNGSLSAEVS